MRTSDLRTHIENVINQPVHLCHVTQESDLPCAVITQMSGEPRHVLDGKSNFKNDQFDIEIFSYSYVETEDTVTLIEDTYDGKMLSIGDYNCRFFITDISDSSYTDPSGGDDWVYSKTVSLQAHNKKK